VFFAADAIIPTYIESYTERDVMSAISCASPASARQGVVFTAIFSISRLV
jgi:hypothetical protein